MPEVVGFPSCFGEHGVQVADSSSKMGQNEVTCIYQTKIAGQCRMITITWCRNLILGQVLSVAVDEEMVCKVEMRPWFFWKKQGSKSFNIDKKHNVDVYWDLSSARYSASGCPEPQGGFYLALVSDKEVILLMGDLIKEAKKKLRGTRPALIDATLLTRREHVAGKKYFTTKAHFGDGGIAHEVMIEYHASSSSSNNNNSSSSSDGGKLCVRVDRKTVVQVKRLMWKFRGNQTIAIDGQAVEVFWDIHNWLFNPGLGNAVFMFQTCGRNANTNAITSETMKTNGSGSGFSLFLYAWKSE